MASAAEEKDEPSGKSASAPAGGGANKLILIFSVLNTLAMVGVIAVLFISFKQQKSTPSIADLKIHDEAKAHADGKAEGHGEGHGEAKEHGKADAKSLSDLGKMVTLEQFTVNLSTPGSSTSRFVRVNVSLEVTSSEAEAEVNGKMPQIRNNIIDLLNSKRVSDLSSVEGRDYLREEIKNALNGFLVHGKVKGVFFTNFNLPV